MNNDDDREDLIVSVALVTSAGSSTVSSDFSDIFTRRELDVVVSALIKFPGVGSIGDTVLISVHLSSIADDSSCSVFITSFPCPENTVISLLQCWHVADKGLCSEEAVVQVETGEHNGDRARVHGTAGDEDANEFSDGKRITPEFNTGMSRGLSFRV